MDSTSLAIIQPEELDTIQRVARLLAVSTFFDGKGDNPQAIAMLATKIMAGRELGFGPFASANNIHVIKGKPTIGANLMASAVKSSGRYDYRVKELNANKCIIEFFERDGDKKISLGISEFTMKDAQAMELTEKDNWKKSPRNMLFARAMSNGVRWFCPDTFSGNAVYVPEEMGADVDGDGNVIDTTYTVSRASPDVDFRQGKSHAPLTNEQVMGVGQAVAASENAPTTAQRAVATIEGNSGHESPPHNRLWGIGMAVLGPDWDMARPWIIKQWTKLETPNDVRKSASELSNDEKSMLGDYLNKNASAVQQRWPKQKSIMIQAVEQEKVAA